MFVFVLSKVVYPLYFNLVLLIVSVNELKSVVVKTTTLLSL